MPASTRLKALSAIPNKDTIAASTAWRRYFHRHPELLFDVDRTAARVGDLLQLPVRRGGGRRRSKRGCRSDPRRNCAGRPDHRPPRRRGRFAHHRHLSRHGVWPGGRPRLRRYAIDDNCPVEVILDAYVLSIALIGPIRGHVTRGLGMPRVSSRTRGVGALTRTSRQKPTSARSCRRAVISVPCGDQRAVET